MNTERNERARSSYLRVLVSIQKWIGGTAGDASVPLSVSSLPLRPARVHGVARHDQLDGSRFVPGIFAWLAETEYAGPRSSRAACSIFLITSSVMCMKPSG